VQAAHTYQLPHWVALPKATQASNLLIVGFSILDPQRRGVGGRGPRGGSSEHGWRVHDVPVAGLRAALEAASEVLRISLKPPTPPKPPAAGGYSVNKGI
jgi:hypothetical protein